MKFLKSKKLILLYSIILVFFIFDRGVKKYFLLYPEYSIHISWTDAVYFHFVKNFGIAFSINLYSPLLIAITVFAIILLCIVLEYSLRKNNVFYITGASLILLGAVSNLYDRIIYGYVVDYIDVLFFSVFNVADAMITMGIIIIFLSEIFNKDKKNLV